MDVYIFIIIVWRQGLMYIMLNLVCEYAVSTPGGNIHVKQNNFPLERGGGMGDGVKFRNLFVSFDIALYFYFTFLITVIINPRDKQFTRYRTEVYM
jgi:hypothetical protein